MRRFLLRLPAIVATNNSRVVAAHKNAWMRSVCGTTTTTTSKATVLRRHFSTTPPAALETGLQNLAQGNWNEAVAAFDQVLASEPTHLRATLNRAIALHNLGRRDESTRVWRETLPRVSDDARLVGLCLFHLGVTQSDAGLTDEALVLFDEALERTAAASQRPEVREVRGRIYCGKGYALATQKRMAEANASWLLGFEASPTDFDNAVSLAHSYHSTDNFDEARRWYLVAARLLPSPVVFCNFASCLAQMKRLDELKELYQTAVAANPSKPATASISYRFGRAFDSVGAYAEAVDAFTVALDCPSVDAHDAEPTAVGEGDVSVGSPRWFAVVLSSRAAAREALGQDKTLVLKDLDDALRHRITLDALLNKSLLCVAMGRKDEAQESLAAAFALDPEGAKQHLEHFYKEQLGKMEASKK